MANSDPVRVLLVGVSADDLDRLRRVIAVDSLVQIVSSALVDGGSSPTATAPSVQQAMREARADVVLMTAHALAHMQGRRERRTVEEPPTEALTARERDVLGYVAEGHGNREIGQLLGISEHTVKFHLASIYGKLGVGNRTEAVQHALRMGLLEI